MSSIASTKVNISFYYQQAALLGAVLSAFEIECGSQTKHMGKKSAAKKGAPADGSACISFNAAVDLLASFHAQHFSDVNTFKVRHSKDVSLLS